MDKFAYRYYCRLFLFLFFSLVIASSSIKSAFACNPGEYQRTCTGSCGGCASNAGENEVRQCQADGTWGSSWGECSTSCAGPCRDTSSPPPTPGQGGNSCSCTYPETCTTSDGKAGTHVCHGIKNSSGTCVWDSSGSCSPACTTCTATQTGGGGRTAQQVCTANGGSQDATCTADPNCSSQGGYCCTALGNSCCYGDSTGHSDGACYRGGGQTEVTCSGNTITNHTNNSITINKYNGCSTCPCSNFNGTTSLGPGASISATCEQLDAINYCGVCSSSGCGGSPPPPPPPPPPSSLTIQGKLYCQDGTGTSYPIANATVPVFMAGSNKTVNATTDADGSYSVNALTSDGAFAIQKPALLSTGKLSNNQPYTSLQGPSPINCNNPALTSCTLSDPSSSLCTGNSYENCALSQGSHSNFDFKYTNCTSTPQVYTCSSISPASDSFERGSSYTFTCQGSGSAAKTANFRVVQKAGTTDMPLTSTATPITLDSTLKAQWQYTIPPSTPAGNYAVQCQICDANNNCTSWGKAH